MTPCLDTREPVEALRRLATLLKGEHKALTALWYQVQRYQAAQVLYATAMDDPEATAADRAETEGYYLGARDNLRQMLHDYHRIIGHEPLLFTDPDGAMWCVELAIDGEVRAFPMRGKVLRGMPARARAARRPNDTRVLSLEGVTL